MQFEDMIRKTIENECEDYYLGVADLSLVQDSLIQKYGSLLKEYPWAISIGITLPYLSPQLTSDESSVIYKNMEKRLEIITSELTSLLKDKGYKAFAVPKIDMDGFVYLHNLAANMAELGKIRQEGLLETCEVVSEVNLGTVLTNASFSNFDYES